MPLKNKRTIFITPKFGINRISEYLSPLPEDGANIYFEKVYRRPPLPRFKNKTTGIEPLIAAAQRLDNDKCGEKFGKVYNQIVRVYQPLINWAISCWDYLLTIEGCRFLPRSAGEKEIHRSDYRGFEHSDYQRLVHLIFKNSVLTYKKTACCKKFRGFLQKNFWDMIVTHYKKLEMPLDQRQRKLTPYSYLRCSPYQFLNPFHQQLVYQNIQTLPAQEKNVIDLYFLNFFTDAATAAENNLPGQEMQRFKQAGLNRLWQKSSLTYALLLQIERY